MADELVRTYGTEITLEASGASLTDGSYGAAGDNNITSSDDGGFPYLLFYGSVAYATAPDANSVIKIYARNLNLISTNDAEVPSDDIQQQLLGYLVLNDVTTTQYVTPPQTKIERPHFDCTIYLKNEGGQTLSAAWALYCKPWTEEPQA